MMKIRRLCADFKHPMLSQAPRWIVGLVFLFSAVGKALAIEDFERVIASLFPLQQGRWLRFLAMEIILLETMLAALLMANRLYRGWTFGSVLAVLMLFSGVIIYGGYVKGISDCGCFGTFLDTSPKATLLKNAALILLTVAAWKGSAARSDKRAVVGSRMRVAINVAPYGVIAIALSAAMTTPVRGSEADLLRRPYARFNLEIDGAAFDLGKGEYFVALLSTRCGPCARRVPDLNELSISHPEMPPIIGLCLGNEEAFARFCDSNEPEFPITLIPHESFVNLIDRVTPRFVHVRDGAAVQVWDGALPNPPPIRSVR